MELFQIVFVCVLAATLFFLFFVGSKTRITTIAKSFISLFSGDKWYHWPINILIYFILPTTVGIFFYLGFKNALDNVSNGVLMTFDAAFLTLLTIFFGIDGITLNHDDPNRKRFAASLTETMGILFVSILLVFAKMVLLLFYNAEFNKTAILIPLFYFGTTGFVLSLLTYVMHSFFNHKKRQYNSSDSSDDSCSKS